MCIGGFTRVAPRPSTGLVGELRGSQTVGLLGTAFAGTRIRTSRLNM